MIGSSSPEGGSRPNRSRAFVAVLVGLALIAAGCSGDAEAGTLREPLLVGAASDLAPAFALIGQRFTEATGERVIFTFGSSGQLAQQIIEGAPMDVFASADAALVERVLGSGRGDPATQATYAFGRLTVWSPEEVWGGWRGVDDLVADPSVGTIAIANPAHAPYGRAAEQVLDRLGLQAAVDGRLVLGENITDTQRLVASGNADAGILALSLAIASDEAGEGAWVLVDASLHPPLRQDLAVVTDDPDRAALAAAFIDVVNGEGGRAILRRFGFLLPDEVLAGGAGR